MSHLKDEISRMHNRISEARYQADEGNQSWEVTLSQIVAELEGAKKLLPCANFTVERMDNRNVIIVTSKGSGLGFYVPYAKFPRDLNLDDHDGVKKFIFDHCNRFLKEFNMIG